MTSLVRVLKKLVVCLALVWLPFISQTAFAYNGPAINPSEFSKILTGKSTAKKQQAIYWLVRTQPADIAHPILSAWLNGQLYHLKAPGEPREQALYITSSPAAGSEAMNVWSNETYVIENKRQFKKVRVNNKLRGILRLEIASLDLNHPEPSVRVSAVNALMAKMSQDTVALLKLQLKAESDESVIAALHLALAVDSALNADTKARIAAIEILADYQQPIVLKTLNKVLSREQDQAVIAAAQRALDDYQQSQRFYSGVETLFFGLSLGSVLVLAGIGLAITFGVMGVINMAHGELIMLGAYTTYVMQQLLPQQTGLALILSIPMAFLVSGLVGIVIERSVIRHLYGRPLETLLATFGISLILQQAVRSVFSPLNRSVSTPEWMSGALEINPMLSLTFNRLYIILFCAMVFIGLVMVLKKTPLGLQVRAVSQNRSMARAMGIRSERVDAMTFGLGSGVAGIAGVALSQLTNVGPNMGQAYIIDSFMVVVFGGVGNLWGTLVAGLSLGLFNKLLEPWAGAVLAKILVLVFIILFIQKRPRGLFPQRGRAAEG
ncbi:MULTISPECIES: urea ABC transporter permease subunit UrtB [Vibrio]|uniref:urea ABC transporter permease subunit UrtB n=1 Tax=Vibrio TaxID=662 RepID=UPI0001B94C48|nr:MULTISPECIES: urea ABC transporter permease subunit UrtB [Vibrio]EEX32676.1 urea ABC transporter permease protein UrtB [Vibrio coralliilyticus ATCC BAA-450]MCM5507818.1 urea ABC transporter permease subunit UrtB [Vibrio sp. SCSIO 43169]MDE3897368.1 urea ABC transporter permease subunit UrtB [Vibrio sp. CC007]QFT39026.1 High-affinity branched-chain amino acid transport system permease protein LivH [Vibrio sp. THAF64]QGM36436.1 High-affinity branched-chain amino acid transport system permease